MDKLCGAKSKAREIQQSIGKQKQTVQGESEGHAVQSRVNITGPISILCTIYLFML